MLAATVVGLTGWRLFFFANKIDQGLAKLRLAYKGKRPTQTRSTANFDFAPLVHLRGTESSATDPAARDDAERLIRDEAIGSQSPRSRHALGLVYLSGGKIDDALRELEAVVAVDGANSAAHSDLGAAYIEKAADAQTSGNGEEFFMSMDAALHHIDRALELEKDRPEALFNRAIAFGKMTLDVEARRAWATYAEKDPLSAWAGEARTELERAGESAYRTKSNQVVLNDFLDAHRSGDKARAWEISSQTKELVSGVMVSRQLVIELLTATETKDTGRASEMSAALEFLGNVEREYAGDHFFLQLGEYYRDALGVELDLCLEAHRAVDRGQELLLKNNFPDALVAFSNAKGLFLKAGNRLEADVTEYLVAYSLTQVGKIAESNERLKPLTEICAARKFHWLETLSLAWIGGNYIYLGEFSRAIEAERRALALARQTSDAYNIQRCLLQLGEPYRALNNSADALRSVYESLVFRGTYYTFERQRVRNLFFATRVSYKFKLYSIAAEYVRAVVDTSSSTVPDPWMHHLALTQLGAINGDLGKYPLALEAMAESRVIADSFEDGDIRRRLTIASLTGKADIERESGDCRAAAADYREAMRIQEGMESVIDRYSALRGIFLCDVCDNDHAAVRTSMPQALEYLDANREKIAAESDRNVFFDSEQGVYDTAIAYAEAEMKDPIAAFGFAEASRARSLLSTLEPDVSGSGPMTLEEIRARMSVDVQMLYYAVLPNRTLIWYVSGERFQMFETRIGSEELESRVVDYLKLLRATDTAAAREASKGLYAAFLGPVEASLDPAKTIVVVADKSLLRVPFAALVSARNRYLIEDYGLLESPSATLFVRESELAARKTAANDEAVLSIGDPAFKRQDYPELEALTDARREAQAVAALYPSARLLVGAGATKSAFLEGLDNADVINFAGHYVPNARTPAQSRLIVAGDLTMQEIMGRRLVRARLVVLSACETGVERYYGGEGMIGAARSFMAAGVPVTVATRWKVDSESAARLIVRFHAFRKRDGLSTSAALRKAQLEMFSETGSRFSQPFYWAGFSTIGGYSDY